VVVGDAGASSTEIVGRSSSISALDFGGMYMGNVDSDSSAASSVNNAAVSLFRPSVEGDGVGEREGLRSVSLIEGFGL
jgi:hypothetical protein